MDLNITSANIRFENPADGVNNWPKRKDFVASIFNKQNLDLLGTQEGREPQLRELERLLPDLQLSDLNRLWLTQRMYPCIFFNPKRIKVYESGDIWLSKTPNIAGSSSFQSAFPRLSTWIKAVHTPSGRKFFYINCHLDHILEETRIEQVKVLVEQVHFHNKESLPIIITGDFNSSPQEEVRMKLQDGISDLSDPWIITKKPEQTSFHKFDGIDPTGKAMRIDWLLHTSQIGCSSISMIQNSRDNRYPSDHFFIHGKLQFLP